MARFRARLGDRFAVLHSALSAGERYDEWRRLRSGEASVCVGPRSAVFAPVRDLGLIVIDEEHDPSYKQEGDPCYDARAVARRRAEECGAVLVAGTATPRPETWLELPRLELPRRVDGLPDAAGRAGRHARGRPPLGPAARRRPGRRWRGSARAGAKAIVMINRRGFAPWLTCRSCGHHWELPQLRRLADRPPPQRPPRLPPLRPRRAAAARLPRVRLDHALAGRRRHRADRGAAAPSAWRRCRSSASTPTPPPSAAPTPASSPASARPTSGVLVGTQMVAKGHDFPEVTLSAILDADATLRFPDFRAEERTFAMVAQLAGRSGRGEAGGEVIVQTLAPERRQHRARRPPRLRRLPRRRARAPPGCCATRPSRTWSGSCLSAEQEARVEAAAAASSPPSCAERLPEDSELLGPAPMFRVRNRHRRRILIKAERPRGDRRRGPRRGRAPRRRPLAARTSRSASTSTRSERRGRTSRIERIRLESR